MARGTLEEASVFLMGAPAVHGLNIQLMARKMKSLGVFLERGELKTLELCFPAKGLLDNHVDGQAIGQMLSNTTINAPDKGKSHEYRYVPSSNANSYGNDRLSNAAEHEDSPLRDVFSHVELDKRYRESRARSHVISKVIFTSTR